MQRSWILVSLSLALVSCGNHDSAALSAQAGDAGSSGSVVDCTSDKTTTAAACGSLAWAENEVTSRPRNHHLTVVAQTPAGAFLYAVGGVNEGAPIANVDRAAIQSDGTLGDFTELAGIPRATGGMTGGVVSNVIVLAGGSRGAAVTNQAYSAVIRSDGSLGAWNEAGTVGNFRMHPASIVNGTTMYVLGGFNDPSVWDDIVSATVSADGSVSAWSPAGTLPTPLSHFSATLHDGYVYVAGGLSKSAFGSPPPLANVYRGRIQDDGTLGDWTPMPNLPESLCTHASFFYGGYLYVGGGLGTASYKEESSVWRAPIGDDHALGAWEAVPSLSVARGHVHQFPVFGNHVYSVAGAITTDLKSTDVIDVGTFD